MKRFLLDLQPQADPAAIIEQNDVRFSVLTSRLMRLEYSPEGVFEERPSQAFWYRRQPVPEFQTSARGGQLLIETEHLRLCYHAGGNGFTPQNLSIEQKTNGEIWRYGDQDRGNLLGTIRTLDRVCGKTNLEPGLLSRTGWTLVDDTDSLVFNAQGWLEPRSSAPGMQDLYFFGYGHDYQACLRDFSQVAGPTPLVPRWALGNWWSRYWEYTQKELLALMAAFQAKDVPLSVCIIDMDWHITDTGNESSGWTGYTWNRDLFPAPGRLLQTLHEKDLKIALNLHPAEGVHPHEEMYAQMAERMGIDPGSGTPVPFDLTDAKFVEAYFELLHHPQEALGIDFWWLDWQQGAETKLRNLDPLWWLNHLHSYDLGRDGTKRPFIFSRWGGLGNHRYPIGFSGDTVVSWESLAFQPYFTATAANVGYGWWSHDIGGHMGGIEDAELYTRWVQFGVFSPILRLHSTKNPFHERHPWGYDAQTFQIVRDAMQLRHALIPYLYSMAWRNHREALAPVQSMYHHSPEREEAYACPQQYTFGTELIAAPFTAPAEGATGLSRQVVWLPQGDWFHFFSAEHYQGGRWYALYGDLGDMPVFAKAGAIVPLGPKQGWGNVPNPDELHVHLFPGADNEFTLYEDDGGTSAYLEGEYCLTKLIQKWNGDRLSFRIEAPSGTYGRVLPDARKYSLYIHAIQEPVDVRVLVQGLEIAIDSKYDQDRETLTLDNIVLRQTDDLRLEMRSKGASLLAKRDRTAEKIFKMLKAFRLDTWQKQRIFKQLKTTQFDHKVLSRNTNQLCSSQTRALLEVLCQAGVHFVDTTSEPEYWVLWNNLEDADMRYTHKQWQVPERSWKEPLFEVQQGIIPRFKRINAHVERGDDPEEWFHVCQNELVVDITDILRLTMS
ncbi:MAG: glycoside hydrolase family 31 protein [Anaerolineaceae bacterium]|nr:glycoside hydrolase family 31 protein [Anaerolineaceae bacterium]